MEPHVAAPLTSHATCRLPAADFHELGPVRRHPNLSVASLAGGISRTATAKARVAFLERATLWAPSDYVDFVGSCDGSQLVSLLRVRPLTARARTAARSPSYRCLVSARAR